MFAKEVYGDDSSELTPPYLMLAEANLGKKRNHYNKDDCGGGGNYNSSSGVEVMVAANGTEMIVVVHGILLFNIAYGR